MSEANGYDAGRVGNTPKEPKNSEYMKEWKEGDTFYRRDVWDAYSNNEQSEDPPQHTSRQSVSATGKFFGLVAIWLILAWLLSIITGCSGWLWYVVLFGGISFFVVGSIVLVIYRHKSKSR